MEVGERGKREVKHYVYCRNRHKQVCKTWKNEYHYIRFPVTIRVCFILGYIFNDTYERQSLALNCMCISYIEA